MNPTESITASSTSPNKPQTKRPRLSAPSAPTRTPAPALHCSFPDCTNTVGFTRKSDLVRHERIHTNDRRWVCDWEGCGKRFIQASALTVHMRTHTGDKPHTCSWPGCGGQFSDKSSLARHGRVHTGARPYECPDKTCPRAFCRKHTLLAHIKRVHEGTGADLADADLVPSMFSKPATRDELQQFAALPPPSAPASVPPTPAAPVPSAARPASVAASAAVPIADVEEEDIFDLDDLDARVVPEPRPVVAGPKAGARVGPVRARAPGKRVVAPVVKAGSKREGPKAKEPPRKQARRAPSVRQVELNLSV